MIWLFYNIFFPFVFMCMLPRFLWRMWRRGGYRKGFLQRFGLYDRALLSRLKKRRRAWIHAVSVGEVFVALRFMEEARAHSPDDSFVLTTTTSTGHAIAAQRAGQDDIVLYFPLDMPFIMRSVLNNLDPAALVMVECELWPNLVRLADARDIPIMLLNGRMSERSYKNYSKIKPLAGDILQCFDLLCSQDETNADRLKKLGADPAKVKVVGSAKYDVAGTPSVEHQQNGALLLDAAFGPDVKLLVGGSTWRGEEAVLLGIYKRLRESYADIRLVLVPRHAERTKEVAAQIRKAKLNAVRRSALSGGRAGSSPDVLLVDTTGELKTFYSIATVIFVGKSLTAHGGQNIIEPAIYAKPIVVGPHMENFDSVAADFLAAGAIIRVADASELEDKIAELWNAPEARDEYGRRARNLVREKAGAVRQSVEYYLELRPLPYKSKPTK